MLDHESDRASFGTALRDVADTFPVPRAEELYEHAVRRGRQLRRRKAVGTGASVGVIVAVAGALTASLLGSGTPTQRPTVPATSVHPGLGKYMAEHLEASFPRGMLLVTGTGIAALSGVGYGIMGSNGIWETSAQAFVSYAGQRYTVELRVIRQWVNPSCGTLQLAHGPCSSKPLGRGTLVGGVDSPPDSSASWFYSWNLAGGTSVELQLTATASTQARNPYTEQQIESLLTAPAWTSVLNGLAQVVKCPDLQPLNSPGPTPAWKCLSTGKTYPASGDTYATAF